MISICDKGTNLQINWYKDNKTKHSNFYQFYRFIYSKGRADIAARTGDHNKIFIVTMFTNQNPGKTFSVSFIKISLLDLLALHFLKYYCHVNSLSAL